MPPKETKDTTTQTFSFETVAVLMATIMENGGNLGAKEYKRMSALDGTKGEHAFNHMFREVKKRAKELNDQAKASGELTPATKLKAAAGSAKKSEGTAASGKKRARKPKKGEEAAEDGDGGEESPSKKVKPEPEEDDEEDAPVEPNYDFDYL